MTTEGPCQPHLCFCLHAGVCLLCFIRSMSKNEGNHCETTKKEIKLLLSGTSGTQLTVEK